MESAHDPPSAVSTPATKEPSIRDRLLERLYTIHQSTLMDKPPSSRMSGVNRQIRHTGIALSSHSVSGARDAQKAVLLESKARVSLSSFVPSSVR